MREALSLRSWRYGPMLAAAGILAVALVLAMAGPRKTAAPAPAAAQKTIPVVMVAARRIGAGVVLTTADIRAKAFPGAIPQGAILSREAAIGRVTARNFSSDEMLLQTELRDAAVVGIAARVPEGERAFSIRVSEDEIVGGFLQSGDHVDIFATIPGSAFPAAGAQSMPDRSQAVLLLQNVQVLAVGENTATRGSIQAAARTVSLSLPPEQLARLTLALRFGKVSLAIRNPGDADLAAPAAATLADLIPHADQPVSAHKTSSSGIPFYAGAHESVALTGGSR